MNLRQDQYRTLYAISTLKAPLATVVCQLLGDSERAITSQKLARLQAGGWVEKKPYGNGRVLFMLTLAGRSALAQYLANHPVPKLEAKVNTTNAHKARAGYEPRPHDPLVALPRTHFTTAPYAGETGGYCRNDGNKHVKSLGAF